MRSNPGRWIHLRFPSIWHLTVEMIVDPLGSIVGHWFWLVFRTGLDPSLWILLQYWWREVQSHPLILMGEFNTVCSIRTAFPSSSRPFLFFSIATCLDRRSLWDPSPSPEMSDLTFDRVASILARRGLAWAPHQRWRVTRSHEFPPHFSTWF